ncbi:MAG: M48 family metalloprotease [Candidatus Lambdaproteobacteria bacterium]|nr:M48 family metalloprotease [Candidatus Lambdaproteobacteria bacterium]
MGERWVSRRIGNWLQALLLLGSMCVLLVVIGWLIAGPTGMLYGLGLAGLFMLLGPRASPALVLRMYRAQRLHPAEAPGLYSVIHALAQAAELHPPPSVYQIPSSIMNAFSVGTRRNASVAVTNGLFVGLSSREIVGVLAHEISHIKHNDMWIMTQADSVSRMIGAMSVFGQILFLINLPQLVVYNQPIPWLAIVLLVFAPTLSALLQLSLSRNREFDADLEAAQLTGDPMGLASALGKLERGQEHLWRRLLLPGYRVAQPSLLRTHPRSEERIRRLAALTPDGDRHMLMPQEWVRSDSGMGVVDDPPRRRWHGVWY